MGEARSFKKEYKTECNFRSQNSSEINSKRMKKIVFFVIVCLCCISCVNNKNNSKDSKINKGERPNILFIMADDHTTQGFGCYGSRLAKLNPTPNIDRLAANGMRFDNVFCNNSICTPSRASILTGQYPQTNGVRDIDDHLDPSKQYLPYEIKKAGYETAIVGKWHLSMAPDSFDYYCVLPGQGSYKNPTLYTNDGSGTPTEVRFQGNTYSTVPILKFEGHSTDVITDIALNWFKDGRKTENPFFMMLHYKAPHDMFTYAERYENYLEDVEIPEPDNMYNQPAEGFGSIGTRGKNDSLIHKIGSSVSKRMVSRNMGKHMKVDKNLSDREYTHHAYQRYVKKFLRCVKGVDDNVQRVLDYLKESGQLDNTIIIYTGDQGFFLGEHDFIDKRWMYDESMRMPFIVHYPKTIKPGSENNWMIGNVDFAPTLLDLAGIKKPDYMQGQSFANAIIGKDKPTNWPTAVYYRYWMHMAHGHNNPAHFGIRTNDYKLIFYYGTDYTNYRALQLEYTSEFGGNRYGLDTPVAWELYDLKKDPGEMKNVYDDPEYAEIVSKLKDQLYQMREDLNETDKDYPRVQRVIDKHWN